MTAPGVAQGLDAAGLHRLAIGDSEDDGDDEDTGGSEGTYVEETTDSDDRSSSRATTYQPGSSCEARQIVEAVGSDMLSTHMCIHCRSELDAAMRWVLRYIPLQHHPIDENVEQSGESDDGEDVLV